MGNEVKVGNEEIRKWRKARGSTQVTWQGNGCDAAMMATYIRKPA